MWIFASFLLAHQNWQLYSIAPECNLNSLLWDGASTRLLEYAYRIAGNFRGRKLSRIDKHEILRRNSHGFAADYNYNLLTRPDIGLDTPTIYERAV